jgi:L-Ala-D/L-Glu epimerase / N-acetyl-D-glutamate racemase
VKITSIDTYPISIALKPGLVMINSLGVYPLSESVVVVIHTDNGLTGLGEACGSPSWSGETQVGTLELINSILSPMLLGQDPCNLRSLAYTMNKAVQHNSFAKAALEMAMLDVVGRSLGTSVSVLLGGRVCQTEIPLKFSIGAYPPSKAAKVAETFATRGFGAFKIKVGPHLPTDLERVCAVRSALGEDYRISVDANGGWKESDFMAARRTLERCHVNGLEEPIRRGDMRGCARIRRHSSIPLILDESVFTPEQAMEAVRLEACDLISIYPGKNGGMWQSLQVAYIAASAGIDCVIGSNLEGNVGSAAMLHIAAVIPNLSKAVDHEIIGPLYHTRVLSSEVPRIEKGRAFVPTGVGLGIDIDLSLIKEQSNARMRTHNGTDS